MCTVGVTIGIFLGLPLPLLTRSRASEFSIFEGGTGRTLLLSTKTEV
jgi:hypothetical protein